MPSTFAAFFLPQASFSEKKWEEPCPRVKAMKAMKSPKLKGILKEQKQVGKNKSKAVKMPKGMKKPSAALALPNNDEGLSLEEKMEKFHEKEWKSVDGFMG